MTQAIYIAAQKVVDNWEKGDLAEAVRELAAVLKDATFASDELVEEARGAYVDCSNDELEIDDGAPTSVSEEGTWVQAWVWMGADE